MLEQQLEDASKCLQETRTANDRLKRDIQKNDQQEELLREREQMMALVDELEGQVKEGHHNLEDALNKIQTLEEQTQVRNQEQEEIRLRITEVAELCEKKEIKQSYSFEVLCDFIYDKAKRL